MKVLNTLVMASSPALILEHSLVRLAALGLAKADRHVLEFLEGHGRHTLPFFLTSFWNIANFLLRLDILIRRRATE